MLNVRTTVKMIDWIIRLIMIFIIALLVSCEEPLENDYRYYVIPKGKHDGSFKMQSLQSHKLQFNAMFDQTAIYESQIPVNQHDINKLMGFSDCNSHHHENSARFGWRWLNDSLEIHAYVYNDGERSSEYIGIVELNETFAYEISMNRDYYVFSLEGSEPVHMERTNGCTKGLYYMLFPYFGGNETAPHDILIKIQQTSY